MRESHFVFLLIYALSFFSMSYTALAEESNSGFSGKSIVINENTQFKFAEQFFYDRDYFRAITEYKKFIYCFPESNLREMAYFKIGEAYFKGQKWEQAIEAFASMKENFPDGRLIDRAYYFTGISYYNKRDYRSSRNQFKIILDLFPASKFADNAKLQIAMSYVEERKWEEAKFSFKKIGKKSDLFHFADNFALGLEEMNSLHFKSSHFGAVIAAIIPGSGHLYAGRKRDAATAFLLNSAFIWGAFESFGDENYAVGGILAFFELGWYFGNIYSAKNSIHKYNKRLEDEYIKHLKEEKNIFFGINHIERSYSLRVTLRF